MSLQSMSEELDAHYKDLKDCEVGRKDDADKFDWTLLPVEEMERVIDVLMFGAKKYDRDNWKSVKDGSHRYLAASLRHVMAIVDGEETDGETGSPHAAHAICSLLFHMWHKTNNRMPRTTFMANGKGEDV